MNFRATVRRVFGSAVQAGIFIAAAILMDIQFVAFNEGTGSATTFSLVATLGITGLVLTRRQAGGSLLSIGLWLAEVVVSAAIMGLVFATFVPLFFRYARPGFNPIVALTVVVLFLLALFVINRRGNRVTERRVQIILAKLEAEIKAHAIAEREKAVAQSRASALRAQLAPHFLWNTLAQLGYLIGKDPEVAKEMAQNLVTYLRSHTGASETDLSTLGEECDAVEAYLNIMKVRMGGRLSTDVKISQDLRDVKIAPFIIPTLVENAIKHGVEPKSGAVWVDVRVKREPLFGDISIEVLDNGVGLRRNPDTRGTGLGLPNVREQIRLHFGESAKLYITNRPSGGVLARLELPAEQQAQGDQIAAAVTP
ncbi:sensor histidine kinase [Paraburkholderia sp. J8-2]|uniref:sensor histidine kinase n=1 Tax=Paraburkholderia sp. J8-2 TaxID=2805440 RepID=UPI002AB69AB4|nr:histidine kinase [Paraburkholderia sp. J8-2]